ncbi:MAG: hypothetical protein ACLQQ4_13105 [Bacteroidia bacterium]
MVGFSKKRPVIITIFSIIGWIIVVLNFLIAFSPSVKKINALYPALYSMVMCLLFISLVGIWYMKRWGVELFVVSFFARDILSVIMNDYSAIGVISFVISVIIIIVLLFFYKSMDRNL